MREGITNTSPDILSVPLAVAGDSEWRLAYWISPAACARAERTTATEARWVGGVFIGAGVLLFICWGLLVVFRHPRQAHQINALVSFIAVLASGQADLTERLDVAAVKSAIKAIALDINALVARLQSALGRVTDSFDHTKLRARVVGTYCHDC